VKKYVYFYTAKGRHKGLREYYYSGLITMNVKAICGWQEEYIRDFIISKCPKPYTFSAILSLSFLHETD
jgi:hypothetical protein